MLHEKNNAPWPPLFTLQRSLRAKSVQFKVCPHRGLSIILPKRFNARQLPQLLQQHRAWIERTLARVQLSPGDKTDTLPENIVLRAIPQTWSIHYQTTSHKHIKVFPATQQLFLPSDISDYQKSRAYLLRWLQHYAKQILFPWLNQLSIQTQLPCTPGIIRNNKTLWGSCTNKKRISLDMKLLLLPPELVEYVLLHELCHTIHFNHSAQFWQLLTSVCPNCSSLKKQLKNAHRYIPRWLIC